MPWSSATTGYLKEPPVTAYGRQFSVDHVLSWPKGTYEAPTSLFVDGSVLYSGEWTTLGDPLAMPMYTLATIHLIKKLKFIETSSKYGVQMTLNQQVELLVYPNGGKT